MKLLRKALQNKAFEKFRKIFIKSDLNKNLIRYIYKIHL